MVEKTLVFHFYAPPEYKDNIAIRAHFECLKKYAHIFNHAIFVISVDNGNRNLINEIEKDILDCGFTGDVRFVVRENDAYYEAKTFKEFVYDKLNSYDGLLFFGHTKGTTNVTRFPQYTENTLQWIYALYFYSLEFIYEVEAKLIGAAFGFFRTFFGPLLMIWPDDPNMDKGHYPGTFYWVNPRKLYEDIKYGRTMEYGYKDRFFAEVLPTVYKFNGVAELDSRMSIWSEPIDLYHCNFKEVIMRYGDYDLYMEGYNDMINKIQ